MAFSYHPRFLGLAAAVGALAVVPSLTDCTTKSCTEMGCMDGATLDVTFPAPSDSVKALHFKLCRNDACVSETYDGGPSAFLPPTAAVQYCDLQNVGTVWAAWDCRYSLDPDGRVHVTAFVSTPYDKSHQTLR